MRSVRARPRLAGPLSVILPDPDDTLLLRACLSERPSAAAAWRAWTASRPDLRDAIARGGAPIKRLLPLLHLALVSGRIDADEAARSILRAAALWEAQRADEIRRILSDTLAVLGRTVMPVLVSGQAFSETVYPGPAARHCHDIDLVVSGDELDQAARALASLGLLAVDSSRSPRSSAGFMHHGGLPIYLHQRLISSSLLSLPEPDMLARAVVVPVVSHEVRTLAPVDMLLHLSGRVASGAVSDRTKWVADAVFLLRRFPPTAGDWNLLLKAAEPGGLALPLFLMHSYLRAELDVAIPDDVLRGLDEGARRTRAPHLDALLASAGTGTRQRLQAMLERGTWRDRFDLMRHFAVPSRAFLEAWCAERGLRFRLGWYVGRPLRGLAMRAGLWHRTEPRAERHRNLGEAVQRRDPPASGEADAQLSSVRLSDFGLRREPPRPVDDRQPGYESLFDYDTLFYDVFRAVDGARVVCLGPPLLNCEPALAGVTFRLRGAASPLACEYQPPRTNVQPSCRFLLSGPRLAEASHVIMELRGRSLEIPIRPSGRARFANRRVVTTLSKDNPLVWLRDWATFNVRAHGADTFIIYDNGSTSYSPREIHDRLVGLDGVASVLVVPWVFPYGPVVGPRNVQDSFYCQPGHLDHVRRRYCPDARSVLNTDVDELVVSAAGKSVFESVEESGRAVMTFPGLWVEQTGPVASEPVRHADCLFGRRTQWLWRRLGRFDRLLRTKWVAVPDRCDDDVEWGVHDVYPVTERARSLEREWKMRPRDVLYRHVRQLTTRPSPARRLVARHSRLRHVYDREYAGSLVVAFPHAPAPRTTAGWQRELFGGSQRT